MSNYHHVAWILYVLAFVLIMEGYVIIVLYESIFTFWICFIFGMLTFFMGLHFSILSEREAKK
jgi:hypothetical protein